MPPSLIAYGLTERRDERTLYAFVSAFVDRNCEDRGDEELMMLPLGCTEVPDGSNPQLDQWEWEPAKTISHSLQRGLDYPRRTFALYYPSRIAELDGVMLGFTLDEKLVLGLSVDDEGMKKENLEKAKRLLDVLFRDYQCYKGVVITDEPVPLSEHEFVRATTHPLTMYCRGIDVEGSVDNC